MLFWCCFVMVGLVCLFVYGMCVFVVWCCTFYLCSVAVWFCSVVYSYTLIGRSLFRSVSFSHGYGYVQAGPLGVRTRLLISSCVDRSSSEVDEGDVGYFDMRDLGSRSGFTFSDIRRLQSIVILAHDAGQAWGCLGWNTMSGCGMATMSDDLMMAFLGLFINRYTM